MKFILVLLSISLFNLNCSKIGKGHNIYKIAYEGQGIKRTSFIPMVTFEGSFDKDQIELFQNKRVLIDKNISTDDIVGVAFSDDLSLDPVGSLYFKFNHEPTVTLDSISSYPYLYFSKDVESDTLRITYSINRRMYK